MSDSEYTNSSLQSSLLLCFATTALTLIPTKDLRYGSLGVVLTYLALVAVHYIRPSTRLDRLNDTLKVATDLLSSVDALRAQNIFELREIQRDLLQAKLSASQIQSDLLEAHDAPWKIYLWKMRVIWRKLNQCARQVQIIRTVTMLTIESESQRRLAQDIIESRETSAIPNFAGSHASKGNTWCLERTPQGFEGTQEA
ncbi:hypothetical protein B0H14DRAFT_2883575 [Mycena olivaceomarginata]|nr:hypothetical protein B0H14DRAFT_2883575 [Mycena olivaceomarginata]